MLADAYNNALRLLEQGRTAPAISQLEDLIARFPAFLDAHNTLGVALKQQGNFTAAARCFEHVIARQPNHDSAINNLGSVHIAIGDFDTAERVLRLAIARTRVNSRPYGNLASVYEKQSRLREAVEVAEAGLAINSADALCRLVCARCLRRSGRLQQAWTSISEVKTEDGDISDNLAAGLLFEQGVILDQLNRAAEAFQRFESANRSSSRTFQTAGVSADRYLMEVEHLAEMVKWADAPTCDSSVNESSPVFLVGFPRSGTTLLGKVLDAHPRCVTLEERPTLAGLLRQIASLPNGYPAELLTLGDEDRLNLQRAYWSDVEQLLEGRPKDGTLLVDQHPFNTSRIWPIASAFPNAKFILALRDPRDVCLSCFMQNFQPNDVTANLCSLEDSASAYAKTMENWIEASGRLKPNTITIRYEDVVCDFEPTVSRLLDFLGVGWHESVRDFWQSSKDRSTCTTASYHQVTQPLYNRAVGRWRRYSKHLHGIADQLGPFVTAFGYEDTNDLRAAS